MKQFTITYAYFNDMVDCIKYMLTMGVNFKYSGYHNIRVNVDTDGLKQIIHGAKSFGAESTPVVSCDGENYLQSIKNWTAFVKQL